MRGRQRYRGPTLLALVLAALLLQAVLPAGVPGDGRLYDWALAARAQLSPSETGDKGPAVAVVAVDPRSLATPRLAATPRALFAPFWAELVNGLADAKAGAIAFDLILASDGASLVGKKYNRSFLVALRKHRNHIVLGHSEKTLPLRRYRAVLQDRAEALGLLEMEDQGDGVVRRITLVHRTEDGAALNGIAAAALARAGHGQVPDRIVPAPRRHVESLPTFALADVLACAETAPAGLRKIFAGKLVFIGSVLREEDRKRPASRYLPPPAARTVEARCPPAPLGPSIPPDDNDDNTVPGVHLHAAAAQAVLDGEWVVPAPGWAGVALAGLLALVGAALGLWLTPWIAALSLTVPALLAWLGQVLVIDAGYWLQTAFPLAALIAAAILAYIVRYLVEERRRLAVQKAFGHFLAPSLVDRMIDEPGALGLGGERRDVTIMFADLSGFTALSTRVGPEDLMRLTNHYLALIADEVDASGGYVDKFIGDAVMAMWGAPADLDDHALAATRAALAMARGIAERAGEAEARGEPGFGIKIGLHAGAAIVGNVGSDKRYNYTAVGETVNIAARLEGLPGLYGCPILVGDEIHRRTEAAILYREIDKVVVKGRDTALPVYQPLAEIDAADDAARASAAAYETALAAYRARDFTGAAARWRALGPDDGPAVLLATRAEGYITTPPPAEWDGDFVMDGK